MQNPRQIFLACFAALFGFALVVLTLVYFAIPPLNQVVPASPIWPGIAHWSRSDIAGAILGDPTQRVVEILILLLTCALAASMTARFLLMRQAQKAALYHQLTRAYHQQNITESERRRFKETLARLAPQVHALAERLTALEHAQSAGSVLNHADYAIAAPAADAYPFKSGLEALDGELAQADAALQRLLPAGDLTNLDELVGKLGRFALNLTLMASRAEADRALAPLADEARMFAEELRRLTDMLSGLGAAAADIDQHLATASELLGDQWMLLTAADKSTPTSAFSEELATLARQAALLGDKIAYFTSHGRDRTS